MRRTELPKRSISFLLLFVLISHVEAAARFTRFPPDKLYVVKGETARFLWDYHVDNRDLDLHKQSPAWIFNNFSTDHTIGFDLRLSTGWKFFINTDDCPVWLQPRVSKVPNATLVIKDVSTADNGEYRCVLLLKSGSVASYPTSKSDLIVTETPTFTVKPQTTITVVENKTLTIRCEASGPPPPNVTWINIANTTVAKGTGSAVYSRSNIKRDQNGKNLKCLATNNPNQTPITTGTTVIVYYEPTIDKAASNSTGTSWHGHSITLRCKWSSANPAPTWTWFKPDGSNITDEARSIHKGSKVTVTTGKESKDYGLFKCRAKNVAGSVEHQINVTQLFPPGQPNVTVTDIEASTATACWTKSAYDGGSPVIDYILEIQPEKGNVTVNGKSESYSVSGLIKDTKYEVKLYARNIVGYGEAANTTFKTKKQGPPVQPIIESAVRHQTSVTLTWLKPEDNDGEITGYTIYKKVKDQDSTWTQVAHISGTLLTYTVKNLEPGKTYCFIVTATNEFGESAKDDSKAKSVTILDAPTTPSSTLAPGEPTKGKSSGVADPNQTIIIVGVVVAVILILITAVISIVILRKKNIFGQGTRKSGRNESAAYHNDVDSNDSLGRQAAVINLNGNDDIPTYAAVDMSKKTKKKTNDIPTYAAVDKSKKKRPGEIIYAELADFNTNNTAAAPRPDQYAVTDYADISQFQQQSEPEPTYANFQGRSKDYANVEDMSSQA